MVAATSLTVLAAEPRANLVKDHREVLSIIPTRVA
jgi:hypothetical protein